MQKQPVSEVEAFPVSLHNTFLQNTSVLLLLYQRRIYDLILGGAQNGTWGFGSNLSPLRGVLRTPLNPLLCIFLCYFVLSWKKVRVRRRGKVKYACWQLHYLNRNCKKVLLLTCAPCAPP